MSLSDWGFFYRKNPWKLGENKLPKIFRKHLPTNEKTKILNTPKKIGWVFVWMFLLFRFGGGGYLFLFQPFTSLSRESGNEAIH